MNDGIKCGHCGDRHASIEEVKACSVRVAVKVEAPLATERQVAYLNDLLAKRVQPDWSTVNGSADAIDPESMTKVEASEAIKVMLAQPVKVNVTEIPDTVPDGRYAYLHEELGKILFYRVVTRRDGNRIVQKVLGAPGDFRYVGISPTEKAHAIKAIAADPGFASQMFGIKVGACGVCGSPLTDPESIARGIGPICAKKYDW